MVNTHISSQNVCLCVPLSPVHTFWMPQDCHSLRRQVQDKQSTVKSKVNERPLKYMTKLQISFKKHVPLTGPESCSLVTAVYSTAIGGQIGWKRNGRSNHKERKDQCLQSCLLNMEQLPLTRNVMDSAEMNPVIHISKYTYHKKYEHKPRSLTLMLWHSYFFCKFEVDT